MRNRRARREREKGWRSTNNGAERLRERRANLGVCGGSEGERGCCEVCVARGGGGKFCTECVLMVKKEGGEEIIRI